MMKYCLAILLGLFISLYSPTGWAQEGPTAISYNVELRIEEKNGLRSLLRNASRLVENQEQGASSRSALTRRIRADMEAFEDILRSEGYYAHRITQQTIENRSQRQIIIEVDPGPRFVLETVTTNLEEDRAELNGKLLDSLSITNGSPARSEDIVIAERSIIQALSTLGYPFAEALDRHVIVDHATQQVMVTYILETGPLTRFGSVVFDGLQKVKPDYLRQFQTWTEGELYTQNEIDHFRRRLLGTGLFQTASVRPTRPAENDGEAILMVSVEEAPARTIALGGGFSTSEGFGGEVSWEHRNLFGQQERLRLEIIGSEIEQSFSGLLSKPHFKRLDQTLDLTTKLGRQDTNAFDKVFLEAGAAIERKITSNLTASVGVDAEILSIQEDRRHDEYLILGAPLVIAWDVSDDPLNPTKGFRILANVKPSVSMIEEDFLFLPVENRSTAYLSLTDNNTIILAARARLGATFGPALNRLPASERFFSGGGGSVRGYGFQNIGPRNIDNDPVGGRSVAEVGFEIRTRLSKTIGLVPFIEGGNVYSEELPQFTGFRWGAGLGLRYFTDVAPIRLDFAFPIDKRAGDSDVQVYVSFGQSF